MRVYDEREESQKGKEGRERTLRSVNRIPVSVIEVNSVLPASRIFLWIVRRAGGSAISRRKRG
jgi:hypothetical protein